MWYFYYSVWPGKFSQEIFINKSGSPRPRQKICNLLQYNLLRIAARYRFKIYVESGFYDTVIISLFYQKDNWYVIKLLYSLVNFAGYLAAPMLLNKVVLCLCFCLRIVLKSITLPLIGAHVINLKRYITLDIYITKKMIYQYKFLRFQGYLECLNLIN